MTMKADSLIFQRSSGTIVNRTKLVYEYDELGKRDKSYAYLSTNNSPWEYQGYYQNIYSGPLPYSIDTELWDFLFYGAMGRLVLMLDESHCVSSLEFHVAEPLCTAHPAPPDIIMKRLPWQSQMRYIPPAPRSSRSIPTPSKAG